MDAQAEAAYDGNALAGPLSEVFAVEVTTAVGRCRGCGRSSQLATLRVYGLEPGLVGRCPGCEEVLIRLARTPTTCGSISVACQRYGFRCPSSGKWRSRPEVRSTECRRRW